MPTVIDVIAESIIQKFNAHIAFKNALGNLYFQQAPQGSTFPYGVFYFNGSTQDEIMGGSDDNITQVDIQFNLFTKTDDGGADISKLVELLRDCYHWQTLNIDGWRNIKTQQVTILNTVYIDNIWKITIDYELWIQKET